MTPVNIRDLKNQIAGETRAREAAELRADLAETRAEKAERAEREAARLLQDLRQQLSRATAVLQSRGLSH